MIQRIQSIYLLIVTVLSVLMLSFPFVKTKEVSNDAILKDGLYQAADNYILFGLVAFIALFAFVNIFLFKVRKVQLTINKVLIVIALGALGLLVYPLVSFFTQNINLNFKPALFFIIGVVFGLILANTRIKKDDKLVKSMDSLR